MSYQVLARKWRPSTFEEMVGQAHVLRALVNALDQQRLHHAYLFTGTRGVGKTTIARLLAKSLNCEKGVSSKPCGECSACTEIAEGRFVDLIEVDAASRTKVEDTRELLENVQYAPTRGRFKVYLIDEVHMLSTSSFNALLKTLEEPPPHVKFLLATTDPQKLPVTVLSRCLQFNLKNMSREHIVQHLTHILGVEEVGFDDPSLWAIAEGAQGSMRDALSLTDQAIAFGQGTLKEQEVASMLGTVDLKRVLKLTHALFEKNIDKLMAMISEIDEHTPDYQALMTEMMSTLHRIAIAQAAPNAIDNNKGDRAAIVELAGNSHAEDVHLYYQIAVKAKPEMSLAPSERAGFEMALLRMLAFSQTPAVNISELPELHSAAIAQEAAVENIPKPALAQAPEAVREVKPVELKVQAEQDSIVNAKSMGFEEQSEAIVRSDESVIDKSHAPLVEPVLGKKTEVQEPSQALESIVQTPAVEPSLHEQPANEPIGAVSQETHQIAPIEASNTATSQHSARMLKDAPTTMATQSVGEVHEEGLPTVATWPAVNLEENAIFWWQVTLHKLGLAGMTKTLFAHSQWVGFDGETLQLTISQNYKKIMNDSHYEKFLSVITACLPGCKKLNFEFGPVELTPQLWVEQLVQKAKDQAYQYLNDDPFVVSLMNEFNGALERESAIPNHNPVPSGA